MDSWLAEPHEFHVDYTKVPKGTCVDYPIGVCSTCSIEKTCEIINKRNVKPEAVSNDDFMRGGTFRWFEGHPIMHFDELRYMEKKAEIEYQQKEIMNLIENQQLITMKEAREQLGVSGHYFDECWINNVPELEGIIPTPSPIRRCYKKLSFLRKHRKSTTRNRKKHSRRAS